ncbi:MAG: hypothetical protein J6C17_02630 [Clostridia bacterium]|nr:hypothetical protein [Clostridia bacterium]
MEKRLESLEMIIGGIEEYLNLAESGLKLFKMTETFSMDGASNLESIRIALLNIRKYLSVIEIMTSKDGAMLGGESYCNFAEFLSRLINEIKRVYPASADKIEFTDETDEPMLSFNPERMQILVYNIARIYLLGSMGQKPKLKIRLYETDRKLFMEFKGESTFFEKATELDNCMFFVAKKIAEVMGFDYGEKKQKNTTRCMITIPKKEDGSVAIREDLGESEIDAKLAEIFFADL